MTDRLTLPADVVEWYLGKWAEWMMASRPQMGYGKGTGVISTRGTTSFNAMCSEMDVVTARKVDAAIQDLAGSEQAAVSHAFLQAVWRWNREPFESVYARALRRLGDALAEKGLT